MDARFKTLDMKLNLIQDNLKVCVVCCMCARSTERAGHGAGRARGSTDPPPCPPLPHPHPPTLAQYFLEILQNRKSDTLEWIIIILIGAEICLSLIDLAGKGLGS